jgi:hypothetical protein
MTPSGGLATGAALVLLESLCRQPEQMKRFVGFVPYFQAPFGTVSKACDDIADEVGAHICALVPCGVMICQVHGHIAQISTFADSEYILGHLDTFIGVGWAVNVCSNDGV